MRLEDKLNTNESKGLLSKISNKIKHSITAKAITYGLAGGLAFGSVYSISGCSKNEPAKPKPVAQQEIYLTPVDVTKITTDSDGNVIASNKAIISFKDGTTQDNVNNVISSINGIVTGHIPQIGFYEIEVPTTNATEIENLITTLQGNQYTDTAEKEYTGTLFQTKDLTDIEDRVRDNYTDVWGFEKIQADRAFRCIREKNKTLYGNIISVIDSSFNTTHIDLDAKVFPGRDFADNDYDITMNDICPNSTLYYHGTHVAGIAGAENNNQLINGVGINSFILPLKVFSSNTPACSDCIDNDGDGLIDADDDGCKDSNGNYNEYDNFEDFISYPIPDPFFFYRLASAIVYAADYNASVINLSVGGPIIVSGATKNAINYASSKGVTIVAGAGNDGGSSLFVAPCSLPGVICVGATNDTDNRSFFSNYPCDLSAPGSYIFSLKASSAWGVIAMYGTSQAAPFVSGLASLLKSLNPNLVPSQLEQIMINTSDDISVDYNGDTAPDATWKRINALKAVENVIGESCDRIAFVSSRDGNGEIYVMYSDGINQTNLTNNPASDYYPAGSPDGNKIAFSSNRDVNFEIYVMNSDGSAQTRLTNNLAIDYYPAWSPDGNKIAFTSYRDGNGEIYVMNSDGSAQTNLTNNPASDSWPTWSPDGTKIAFISRVGGNDEIYIMNADGSAQTRLTNNPANDVYPTWSFDGTRIAFSSNRDVNFEIYVMNSDGSAQTRLTNNPAEDSYPAWSPDGTRIAFISQRDGNSEVYVMNADGSTQTRLTNDSFGNVYPTWLP